MLSPHSAGDGAGEGDRPLALGFYRFLNRLKWPRTYVGRLILVCAAASSLPLFLVLLIVNLIYVETGSRPGGLDLGVFVAVVGAVLIGIGLMLAALRRALAPLQLTIAALDTYRRDGHLPALPDSYQDEPGRLMSEIRSTIDSVESTHADLRRRAETDPLTEVANRRSLIRRGDDCLRDPSAALPSVVLIDLDRFKCVNDTYGHAAGDGVLRTVAGIVQRMLRSDAVFARVGGEEFAILLPETTLQEALSLCERLRQTISVLSIPSLQGACVTASFGATVASREESKIETVLHRADMALYDAKRSGRNCVRYKSADDPVGMRSRAHRAARTGRMTFPPHYPDTAPDGFWMID